MNKFSNRWFIIFPITFVLGLLPQFSWGQEKSLDIQLESHPDFSMVVPDRDPARLTLRVLDQNGHPVKNVIIHSRLESPRKSILISTDFPIVEGTFLWDFTTISPDGEWTIEYVFPIRGLYHLRVSANPLSGGDPTHRVTRVFHLKILENPREIWNVRLLVLGLFLFGAVSGFILFQSRYMREGK